jgi:hypothetical protein
LNLVLTFSSSRLISLSSFGNSLQQVLFSKELSRVELPAMVGKAMSLLDRVGSRQEEERARRVWVEVGYTVSNLYRCGVQG